MSYQALARKWRPQIFGQLVGQTHVVTALSNALNNDRLHHAYLFTGTRGVGKTTIARIFAKSLNCINGVTAEPCGQCQNCVAIEQGRFVDLVEVDAASRTKVEDTREILDNVQYSPSQGRYKVYLIDEVHMLSRHSFNALLKTLEEPPPHVKFLLATTDPQKLPITILSRCLQFSLKALTAEQIQQQLAHVLSAENLPFEPAGITQLANAANGSMRDALSLTDQAVAQGNGQVAESVVRTMLGMLDEHHIAALLMAVTSGDFSQVMAAIEQLSLAAVEPEQALLELINAFHQIALVQVLPSYSGLNPALERELTSLAQQLNPELVQLYYQILLDGRKDLPFAANPRSGLEMTLLRALSFTPVNGVAPSVIINEQPASLVDNSQLNTQEKKTAELGPSSNKEANANLDVVDVSVYVDDPQATNQQKSLNANKNASLEVSAEASKEQQLEQAFSQSSIIAESSLESATEPNVVDGEPNVGLMVEDHLGMAMASQFNDDAYEPDHNAAYAQPMTANERAYRLDDLAAQQTQIEALAASQGYQEFATDPSVNREYNEGENQPTGDKSIAPDIGSEVQVEEQPNESQHTAAELNPESSISDSFDVFGALQGIRAQKEALVKETKDSDSALNLTNQAPASRSEQTPQNEVNPVNHPSSAVQPFGDEQPDEDAPPWVDELSGDMFAEPASDNTVEHNLNGSVDPLLISATHTTGYSAGDATHVNQTQQEPEVESAIIEPPHAVATQEALNDETPFSAVPETQLAPSESLESLSLQQKVREGVVKSAEVDLWAKLVDSADLVGLQRQFALHSTLEKQGSDIVLSLQAEHAHLDTENNRQKLTAALHNALHEPINLKVMIANQAQVTPFNIQSHIDGERLAYAKELIHNDPNVIALQQMFDAKVDEESIKPL
ncbi:hypothetical protein C2869_02210 [Saccharobesus litoralis]|uniref:DNA-directed DNA polymerase n=1 Tax=Saccharobesus litoralis TaxID=2172099 RepID=A0A2S0VM95_9ALTE|nr:DNA polymerase III subunit gamma/tau [Saccharobesus litoralis]AWB65326.1 hypothetical protein C2869_02210 [Saccharobesus litoralis]